MTETRRAFCGLCHPRCGVRLRAEPELFGVFESNANLPCPDAAKFCSPEIGGWPHTALLCRVEAEEAGARSEKPAQQHN